MTISASRLLAAASAICFAVAAFGGAIPLIPNMIAFGLMLLALSFVV